MNKKLVTAGLAAGLLAGTGAGLILQMSGSAGAAGASISASPDSVDTSDSATDPATDAARAADRSTRLQEVLKPLVDAGTLTQAQADSVVETLAVATAAGRASAWSRPRWE